jgi:hypothetical protein
VHAFEQVTVNGRRNSRPAAGSPPRRVNTDAIVVDDAGPELVGPG